MALYKMSTGLDGGAVNKALGKSVMITKEGNNITIDSGKDALSATDLTKLNQELSKQLGIVVDLKKATEIAE